MPTTEEQFQLARLWVQRRYPGLDAGTVDAIAQTDLALAYLDACIRAGKTWPLPDPTNA